MDQALYAVVMEAYVAGVSTRKVDALVAALGSQSGISKSQVSRICADIDIQVQAFLNRPLEASGYAYLYLDATYLHGRLGRGMQVCSRADVGAMGGAANKVSAVGGWIRGEPGRTRRRTQGDASRQGR